MSICVNVRTYVCTFYYNVQKMDIPTMETGCEVAKRAYKELTDIQVTYIRVSTYVHISFDVSKYVCICTCSVATI